MRHRVEPNMFSTAAAGRQESVDAVVMCRRAGGSRSGRLCRQLNRRDVQQQWQGSNIQCCWSDVRPTARCNGLPCSGRATVAMPTEMLNNHSLGSAEQNTSVSENSPARRRGQMDDEAVKDRGDSDSESSDFGSSEDSTAMSQSFLHQQPPDEPQRDSQQGQRLIIPRQLHLDPMDIKTPATTNTTGTTVTTRRLQRKEAAGAGSGSPQQDYTSSDNEDGVHVADVATASEEVSVDSESELIFQPSRSETDSIQVKRRNNSATTIAAGIAKRGAYGLTMSPRVPPHNKLQKTSSQNSDKVNHCQSNRCGELYSPSSGFTLDQLPCDLDPGQDLPVLCTSSSNCCRGGNRKHHEASHESSYSLVCGTTVLSRPGSLTGINIEGLGSMEKRRGHKGARTTPFSPVVEDEEVDQRPNRKSSNKKSVSFSRSVPEVRDFDENDEVMPEKCKNLGDSECTENEASEIDSDSKLYQQNAVEGVADHFQIGYSQKTTPRQHNDKRPRRHSDSSMNSPQGSIRSSDVSFDLLSFTHNITCQTEENSVQLSPSTENLSQPAANVCIRIGATASSNTATDSRRRLSRIPPQLTVYSGSRNFDHQLLSDTTDQPSAASSRDTQNSTNPGSQPQLLGSNGANSNAAKAFMAAKCQPASTRSIRVGYCSWTDGASTSSMEGGTADGSSDVDSSYVVFLHPPESENTTGAAPTRPNAQDTHSDSVAFSWADALRNSSNDAPDLSATDNRSPSATSGSSSRCNINVGGHNSYAAVAKVTVNQLKTQEGHLSSAHSTPQVSRLRVSSVRGSACVKPSAVGGSAAVPSVAKSVAMGSGNCVSTESDSSRPVLMLETLSCGHKGHKNGRRGPCPNSCASPQSKRERASGSCRRHFERASASNAAAREAAAAAATVHDLLADAFCDPSEAAALARTLLRGLVCNVESLRSSLAATLMLLKNRRRFAGPLAQAIGTADLLDDLVHRVQDRQYQQRHRRKDGDSDARTVEGVGCSSSCDQQKDDGDARLRCWRSACSPQCQAMAHYVIGEQFVEPSLERQASLQCRPSISRVVPTESTRAASGVAASAKLRRQRR